MSDSDRNERVTRRLLKVLPGGAPREEEESAVEGSRRRRLKFVRLTSGEQVLRVTTDPPPKQLAFPFFLQMPESWPPAWWREKETAWTWFTRVFGDSSSAVLEGRIGCFLGVLQKFEEERAERAYYSEAAVVGRIRALRAWKASPRHREDYERLLEAVLNHDRVLRLAGGASQDAAASDGRREACPPPDLRLLKPPEGGFAPEAPVERDPVRDQLAAMKAEARAILFGPLDPEDLPVPGRDVLMDARELVEFTREWAKTADPPKDFDLEWWVDELTSDIRIPSRVPRFDAERERQ